MKYLITFLFLCSFTQAQNVWYVDRDATGANTGRNWTDAWNYLDSSNWMGSNGVNWAIVGDGDTIYVSGGTDSTRYSPPWYNYANGIRREGGEVQPTFNEQVVVMPAKDAPIGSPVREAASWSDHNGDVHFVHSNETATSEIGVISSILEGQYEDSIIVSGSLSSANYFYTWWRNIRTGHTTYIADYIGATNAVKLLSPDVGYQVGDTVMLSRVVGDFMLFVITGVNNVKFTGFNFIDARSDSVRPGGGAQIYGSDNVIENCYFYSRGLETGVYLSGTRLIFRNNYYDSEENSFDNDIDPIGIGGGGGNNIIEGNIVIIRNTSTTTGSHRDMVQWASFAGWPANNDMIIRNNLIIQKGQGTNWNAVLYASGVYVDTTKWYIYNNIFVNETSISSMGSIFLYHTKHDWHTGLPFDRELSQNFWIFNNTLIVNSPSSGLSMPISLGTTEIQDTTIIKNNLVITDAPVNLMFSIAEKYFGDYHLRVDYNGWFEYGGLSGAFMNGNGFGSFTYRQWQSYNLDTTETRIYDINSITGNSTSVTFQNKYGVAFEDYYTETGRGLGVNLAEEHPEIVAKFPDIMYDALGNPRPEEGAWDIGALQYIETGIADTIPSYSFTAVTNAELNTLYTGSAIFSGADSTFTVYTTTDASFSINSGAFNTTTKTAENGDTLNVRNTTGGSYSTLYRETIIAGGVSRNFDVTTKAEPVSPPTSVKRAVTSSGRELRTINGRRIMTR
jgi:hypothetical protein